MTATDGVIGGVGVSPGVGAGPVRMMPPPVPAPPIGSRHDGDAGRARTRAEAALQAVGADLDARAALAAERGRVDAADVLTAQALMARDPDLAAQITAAVDTGASPARAAYEAFAGYRDLLSRGSPYLAARVADLDDIRDRVVARLTGAPMPGVPLAEEPYVLVARDLAPADTALIDPQRILAFVTAEGGPTSHTAILARAMGVPAVVAAPAALELTDGTPVLVDGAAGTVAVDPGEETVAEAGRAARARATAVSSAEGPGRTADGMRVPLLANIAGPWDVSRAREHGAEGVGLFRTEVLFLDATTSPSLDEQVGAYREVLAGFPGRRVVIRTLDAGADKPLGFLATAQEPNPALGERALRMMRHHPEILETQLRAMAVAAEDTAAELWVMAPMVADGEDAAYFTRAARAAGLQRARLGVMIEIPAAAMRLADFVHEVNFVSIGTNDLAQYAYAADRQLGSLARFQDPWLPGHLDLVAAAAQAAAATGRPCGVCGEAAADPVLACVLVGLGVTSLSMSGPALPLVRAVLAAHSTEQCRAAAGAARRAETAAEAKEAAHEALPGAVGFGL